MLPLLHVRQHAVPFGLPGGFASCQPGLPAFQVSFELGRLGLKAAQPVLSVLQGLIAGRQLARGLFQGGGSDLMLLLLMLLYGRGRAMRA